MRIDRPLSNSTAATKTRRIASIKDDARNRHRLVKSAVLPGRVAIGRIIHSRAAGDAVAQVRRDDMTQWEIVAATPQISERLPIPVLED
jgi:hypothetical protein